MVPEEPKGTDELVKVKLPDETPRTWPALVECVTACFAQLCDDYAGPMQYLNLCYPDAAARDKFGDWLTMELVSEKPCDSMLGPSAAARGVTLGTAYLVHPAALNMLPISSSKPAPYPRVSKLLADEILKNGFLSEHDHLIVHNPVDDTDSPSKYGWLHYIKGSARSATLLAIIKLMLQIMGAGTACRFLNTELWETFCRIYVRWDVWRPDKRTISFRNAKLSHAGSIREPNDLITWAIKLKALHDTGSPGSLIVAWNEEVFLHTSTGLLIGYFSSMYSP